MCVGIKTYFHKHDFFLSHTLKLNVNEIHGVENLISLSVLHSDPLLFWATTHKRGLYQNRNNCLFQWDKPRIYYTSWFVKEDRDGNKMDEMVTTNFGFEKEKQCNSQRYDSPE